MSGAQITDPSPDTAGLEHLDACIAQLPRQQRTVIMQHFLVGATRDEVAHMLGIGIDTVHQHCHRGIARLRTLLRRRGVVLPEVAIVGVFADQARSAASAATVSAAPTAAGAGAAYAGAVLTAMTLMSLIPVAIALLVVALMGGAAAVLQSREPVAPMPAPALASASPPLGTASPLDHETGAGDGRIATALAKGTYVEFAGTSYGEAIATLALKAGIPISIDPAVTASQPAPVQLLLDRLQIGCALWWVEEVSGTHHAHVHGGLVLRPGPPPEASVDQERAWNAALAARMSQPISFVFANTPLRDVISYLRQATGDNIIISPTIVAPAPLTLTVDQMPFRDALHWICELNGDSFRLSHQSVVVEKAGAPLPAHAPQRQITSPPAGPQPGF